MDVVSNFAARYERNREEELSIEEYLAECRRRLDELGVRWQLVDRRGGGRCGSP